MLNMTDIPVRKVDIAKKIGVSVTTVSLALRGSPLISSELRVRIKDAANKMGYLPNLAAQELRGNSSRKETSRKYLGTIGHIMRKSYAAIYHQSAYSKKWDEMLKECCENKGYKLIFLKSAHLKESIITLIISLSPAEYAECFLKKIVKRFSIGIWIGVTTELLLIVDPCTNMLCTMLRIRPTKTRTTHWLNFISWGINDRDILFLVRSITIGGTDV